MDFGGDFFGGVANVAVFACELAAVLRLTEWMACAGVDLQLADEKMRSRHPLETTLGKRTLRCW